MAQAVEVVVLLLLGRSEVTAVVDARAVLAQVKVVESRAISPRTMPPKSSTKLCVVQRREHGTEYPSIAHAPLLASLVSVLKLPFLAPDHEGHDPAECIGEDVVHAADAANFGLFHNAPAESDPGVVLVFVDWQARHVALAVKMVHGEAQIPPPPSVLDEGLLVFRGLYVRGGAFP